jgi:Xaa-Pro dipeptidase
VEFSRALIKGKLDPVTARMAEAYPIAMEEARKRLREGKLASSVHKVIADVFKQYGFALGHLSGHAIGTTMLEYPSVGAQSDVELKENMVLSVHPQVVDQDGRVCLYTQDTYRVGKTEGENLADVPWKFYQGGEV